MQCTIEMVIILYVWSVLTRSFNWKLGRKPAVSIFLHCFIFKMEHWKWVTAGFEKPKQRYKSINDRSRPKPLQKPTPHVNILPNMAGLRTDEQHDEFMARNRRGTVSLHFGSFSKSILLLFPSGFRTQLLLSHRCTGSNKLRVVVVRSLPSALPPFFIVVAPLPRHKVCSSPSRLLERSS